MSAKSKPTKSTELVNKLLSGVIDEKYQGKQVVLMGNKVYILPDDDHKAAALVEDLEKQYPSQIPHLVSVPRPETYIL